jgi:hypothetical protein
MSDLYFDNGLLYVDDRVALEIGSHLTGSIVICVIFCGMLCRPFSLLVLYL